jgi:hypothetical protein
MRCRIMNPNLCRKCGAETERAWACAPCLQAECLDGAELHCLLVLNLLREHRVKAEDMSAEVARELHLAAESAERAKQLSDEAELERCARAMRAA